MSAKTHTPALEFIHVSMRFGDFVALDDVNLRLEPYRFHVLLGENGAGKSTLVKCLVGYQKQSEGQIVVDGFESQYASPREAQAAGLGMVYQSFTLADQMSVAEHFYLAQEKVPALARWSQHKAELEAFLATMPFRLDLQRKVGELAAGEKQKLEILLQLYRSPRILILDEPSSVLTPAEADEVLGVLKDLVQERKLTIVLITHKFREYEGYGDTVAVLKRGKLVASGEAKDFGRSELAELMVGEKLPDLAPLKPQSPGATKLECRKLSLLKAPGVPALRELSFSVREGEIYGLAGVSGNGQKELLEVLTGLHGLRPEGLFLGSEPFVATSEFFSSQGYNLIPELPLKNACVRTMSVWENLGFRDLGRSRAQHRVYAEAQRERYAIKAPRLGARVDTLSGGNVQRVVLAREIRPDTKLLVAANPCFGLDFLASAQVRQALRDLRERGAAVLLVSEDLDEILELSDRIGVLFEGQLIYETSGAGADLAQLGAAMAGKVA